MFQNNSPGNFNQGNSNPSMTGNIMFPQNANATPSSSSTATPFNNNFSNPQQLSQNLANQQNSSLLLPQNNFNQSPLSLDQASSYNASEPVSVDELESILRDWHFNDDNNYSEAKKNTVINACTYMTPPRGNNTLSQSNINQSQANNINASPTNENFCNNQNNSQNSNSLVDVHNWSMELLNSLRMCNSNDEQGMLDLTKQYLRAFETQAVSEQINRKNKLQTANRVLVKTLKQIHRNHKILQSENIPNMQREIEELKQKLQISENKNQVLQLHLQTAMGPTMGGGGGSNDNNF